MNRRLGDISTTIDYGVTASAVESSVGPKFLRITDIQNGTVNWDSVPWCDCSEREAKSCQLEDGDIVFARTGATTGKSFLIRQAPSKSVFASYLIRVRLGKEANPVYVSHFFNSPSYWRQITGRARGVAQPGVNSTSLKTLEIPLPPLAEQKRIAGILDAADALRAKRREALAQLDTLLQATFLDLFGSERPPISIGPVQFGDGKDFVQLGKVAVLATGHTPDREVPQYWGGDVPWISLTDIRCLDGTIAMETGQNITEAGLDNSSSVRLPSRTVCLSRTASIGFVTVMGREMATSQDFVNWTCGERLDPIYLMWALRVSRPYLLSKASGSTHKTIYYRHAEQFEVNLPPIADQKKFAAIVESVDGQRPTQRAHLAELDALFASLQSRAFRGEL